MTKKIHCSLFFLVLFLASSPVFAAESSYLGQFANAWKRGLINIVTSPLEIPITVREYHAGAGRPVIRHSVGFVDGTFQMIERLGSGALDLATSIVPGQQQGIPVDPEMIF